MAVGGGSAERRAKELASSGDEAAAAWAAGAEGERRVAEELSNLREAWTVLHDRLLRPGQSEANLDHVVIGPGGMFLIDAKNRAGRVTAWEGGLFQHTMNAGDPVSLNLAGELKKVRGMASYMAVESGRSVTPVLCLAGAHEAKFGEPQLTQGVWVVPVSRLVQWLNARPYVLERATAERVVTRAMTDFPSTTTDPQLLTAIGQAAAHEKRVRPRPRMATSNGGTSRTGGRQSSRRRRRTRRSFAARLMRAMVGLVMMLVSLGLFVTVVPSLVTALVGSLATAADPSPGSSPASTAVAPAPKPTTATVTAPAPKATSNKAPATEPKPNPKPAAPALAPTDCARATGAEVAKVLGRKVQPITVRTGCAWGTRLDDPSTTLVLIRLSDAHAASDLELVTSARQQRVVYGRGYDPGYRPVTTLWVAKGQPLSTVNGHVKAQADTYVGISTTMLGLTDDMARRRALAIAAALNN